MDASIQKAIEAEKKFLSDEQARYLYDMREKAEMDYLSSIATARDRALQEGMERGMERGAEKERSLTVQKMVSCGMSIDEIAKIYGVSRSEIEKLLQ